MNFIIENGISHKTVSLIQHLGWNFPFNLLLLRTQLYKLEQANSFQLVIHQDGSNDHILQFTNHNSRKLYIIRVELV
jgi:predicted GNAT family N-acyltransferase